NAQMMRFSPILSGGMAVPAMSDEVISATIQSISNAPMRRGQPASFTTASLTSGPRSSNGDVDGFVAWEEPGRCDVTAASACPPMMAVDRPRRPDVRHRRRDLCLYPRPRCRIGRHPFYRFTGNTTAFHDPVLRLR